MTNDPGSLPSAPKALRDMEDFLSAYLGCDIREVMPGEVRIVASERRTRAELHYGDVFAIWGLVLHDRAVVSVQPGLTEAVRRIIDRHGLAAISDADRAAELTRLLRDRQGADDEVSEASWLFYYCSRETFRPVTGHTCRPATTEDLAEIMQEHPYDTWLNQSVSAGTCYVALDGRRPVAVCGTFGVPHLCDRIADVGLPGTAETHRRRGYGASVLSAVTDAVLRRDMTPVYSVSPRNDASIATVEAVGYRRYGRDFRIRVELRD
ncbi:MAG: GNAT family N-acetyltransferase [candidate division WOR-3 bacterium]|nr:GNAT family N-acetyltransferase [candidate division WOR-3 bacterium]